MADTTVPMSISRRIIASKAGVEFLSPGDLCSCPLDIAMGNDITVPPAINIYEKHFADLDVDNNCRFIFCMDHFVPCKDIKSAQNVKQCREFAKKYSNISYFIF